MSGNIKQQVEEVEDDERVTKSLLKESPETPLFLEDSPEGNKGNAQDEKDETEE